MRRKLFICILFFIQILTAFSQEIPKRTCYAHRLQTESPRIDGKLDDTCWQGVGWIDDFTQQRPNEGEDPSQETEFKVIYDDRNLYVAIRAFNRELEKIDVRVSRRDNFAGDRGGIAFDSNYDHRTAYGFNLTAGGSKIDVFQMDVGKGWIADRNWDAVWDGKTAIEDSVWTAEMRIPFNQLRFAKKEEQVMGLHVWRYINRKQEESQFQLLPRDLQGRIHAYGILKGIKNIPTPRNVEILPYFRSSLNSFKPEKDNPFAKSGQKWGLGLGLNGRIKFGGIYNLDLTVNPDFGQVEVDPSVVNLTSFETFYEEKRPFFMEGATLLNFNVAGQSLFYSRRIGRSPSYYPRLNTNEYMDIPDNTTILGAAKITAKTPTGWSLGALSSITSTESAEIKNGNSRMKTVEPLSNYTVGRIQRDFSRGKHSLGAMFSAVHRYVDDDHLNFLPKAAYTGGFDWMTQWGNRAYYIDAKGVFSHVRGHQDAILRLQKSSVHYFQRADADHIEIDSSRSSLTGTGGEIAIGKGGGGRWRFEEKIEWLSPGLELNDIGYIRKADLFNQETEVSYIVNDPSGIFNYYHISSKQYNKWNFNREYLLWGGRLNANIQFNNFWSMNGSINREQSRLNTHLLRGGPAIRLPDVTTIHYSISSGRRERVRINIGFSKSFYNDDLSNEWGISSSISVRATDNIDFSFSPDYTFNRDNWQYINVNNLSGDKPYVLGLIDQKTMNMTIRLNYYITPDLSIQYYGQPFISAGHFSNFKRITNPRAKNFEDRYLLLDGNKIHVNPSTGDIDVDENEDGSRDYWISNPNFNFLKFQSNLVLRWEYKPGSTFYFVWAYGRSERITNGVFNFSNNIRELFDIYPNNVFLIKFNHWFSL